MLAPTIRLLEGTGSWTLPHIRHFPLLALKSTPVMRQKLGMCWQLLMGNPQKRISQCVPHKIPVSSVGPGYCPLSTLATDSNCTCHGLSDANGSAHYFINCVPHLIIEALCMSHTPMSFTSELQDHVTPICFMMVAGQGMWWRSFTQSLNTVPCKAFPQQHARSGGHQRLESTRAHVQSNC